MHWHGALALQRGWRQSCTPLFVGVALLSIIALTESARGSITMLPPAGGTLDGIDYSVTYDDWESYSAEMLEQLRQNGFIPSSWAPLNGGYRFTVGTGTLDVLLYTGAVGQDNQGVGPSGTNNFEDPVVNSGGNVPGFEGWWGQDDQGDDGTTDGVNGPVTVGQVLSYLQEFDPSIKVPVFYIDLNQTGASPTLDIAIRVTIRDPLNNNAIVHEWAMDTNPQAGDGVFDLDSPLTTTVPIKDLPGLSGNLYDLDPNKGSGKPDFIAVAPTMDLSLFNPTHYFVAEAHLGSYPGHPDAENANVLNNGFEEIFLTGGIAITIIPEPSTLIIWSLLGALAVAVGWCRRRPRAG